MTQSISKKILSLAVLVSCLGLVGNIAADKKVNKKERSHGKAVISLLVLGGSFALLKYGPLQRVLGRASGGVEHGKNLATLFSAGYWGSRAWRSIPE